MPSAGTGNGAWGRFFGRNRKDAAVKPDGFGLEMLDWEALYAAGLLLLLGAASPGPSLIVVLRNATAGGRRAGAACALGHGLGFGLYATSAVLGLSALMAAAPGLFAGVQFLGAVLLLYLAWSAIARPSELPEMRRSAGRGFVEGFLVAFLNPKIALFFIAVLSAVLREDLSQTVRFGIAAIGWLIDTLWYLTAAFLFSTAPALKVLRRLGRPIDWSMAALLAGLAVMTLWRLTA